MKQREIHEVEQGIRPPEKVKITAEKRTQIGLFRGKQNQSHSRRREGIEAFFGRIERPI